MWENNKRITIYFDGWCPLCQRSSQMLKKLDLFHQLEHASFRDPEVIKNLSIPYEALESRLHVYDPKKNQFTTGIEGVLRICKTLIPLWPFVPMLQLSIWLGIGERVYDYIARNRVLVPTGCTDACQIKPPREKNDHTQKK